MIGAVYKPGQGYWTRLMSIIGMALLVLMGVAWMWKNLATTRLFNLEPVYVQAGMAVIVLGVFTMIGYWLIGTNQRAVEFMIATESEMKKVNWSTKREIMGSTWVVIGFTFLLALLCFLFDNAFAWLFQVMKVLETS
jgi:preprotein translocase SecE subunit